MRHLAFENLIASYRGGHTRLGGGRRAGQSPTLSSGGGLTQARGMIYVHGAAYRT
jgi:hypothetical protein